MSRMNILFVNNGYNLFAEADCGAAQRSMRFIQALKQMGHVDVVSFTEGTASNVAGVDVIYSKQVEKSPIVLSHIDKLLRPFRLVNDPYAIYPTNIEKENIIDKIVSNGKYDLIVIRYIHFACECGLLKYADRLMIDIDDDPKQVLQMAFPQNEGLLKRLYHRLYANVIDIVSRRIIQTVKYAFYSTPDMHYHNAHFLPNMSVFHNVLPPPDFTHPPTMMMVGWFKYPPNIEGLSHFITDIYPKIRSVVPNVIFNIVGKMPDEKLRDICMKTEGVNVLGFVENIEEQYEKCHCVVIPIYSGTGTSVKMVEAMSIGRSVVATSCGARGINSAFQSNKDYFLATSDDDFAQKVSYLLTHPKQNVIMADGASQKVGQYYSETKFNDVVLNAIRTF